MPLLDSDNFPFITIRRNASQRKDCETEKKGVLIVNNARRAIVDTQAVVDGCSSGHIGVSAYSGDVWYPQPALKDHPWRYYAVVICG
ncbi:putative formate dehydrogenase [Helianthus annuus]|nr:putative formate dehydrogenase [Helianthus annuus]KAJ0505230.1 putative formate dehydrogenase [Helianthus annuus]KAJ0674912.1 putative formate dehydrogenase [Helianthus annuus]